MLSLSLSHTHTHTHTPLLLYNLSPSSFNQQPHNRMALQSASRPSTPSAQIVGNAFVEQYYHILHHSPELVFRFYEESSVISRPELNGLMTSVTTMQGINEKILSLNYKDFKAEIKTADAQKSYKDGVLVVVTGSLMGKDNLKRKFTQSFFLAPQNNGYFVLNDVFRYVEDSEPFKPNLANEINDLPAAPLTSDPELPHVSDPPTPDPVASHVEDNQIVVEKIQDTLDSESPLADDKVDPVETQANSNGNDASAVAESSSSALDDTPKKSYASIVSAQTNTPRSQVMKGSAVQNKVYVATKTLRVAPAKTEKQSSVSVVSPPVPETPGTSSISPHESSNSHDEVEGYSIYVRNLPFNVTVSELEAAFKKFGRIKQRGIQVRSHKHVGHCFGFVEFLSSSSMEDAIQASPVTVGGRQAIVEIKKTSSRVGSGRGGFPPGRGGGFQNDSFRGRGNFGGGQGYGRNDFGNRGEFLGRGRGPVGRTGEDYQQGRGRGGRSIRSNQNTDYA